MALALAAVFLGTLLLVSLSVRAPGTTSRVARLFLVFWIMLIGAATLTISQPLGTGGNTFWPVPFETLLTPDDLLAAGEKEMYIRQLTANALMFVPLPALVRTSFGRASVTQTLLACIGLSAFIELTQWLQSAGRVADVDDLLLNSVGATVGTVIHLAAAGTVYRWSSRRIGNRPGTTVRRETPPRRRGSASARSR
ncbi:hypothetical protein GCM10009716_06510 [Streptomyces sodiiphilus]|uniref:VanZ-like domain-containing protein n=1 Tax=Streptomyces sodiiphilus TaxID=226217 RepID=A0ABN2NU19_9ACTN